MSCGGWILMFVLTHLSVFCEDCVTYNFEDGFEDLFTSGSGTCENLAPWKLGKYKDIELENPHIGSTKFIYPPDTVIGCGASFGFPLSNDSVLELKLYMDQYNSQWDFINIQVLTINEVGTTLALTDELYSPMFPTFVPGWTTLRLKVFLSQPSQGFIILKGRAMANSTVLVDSFRYITHRTEESKCLLYEDSVSTTEVTSTSTAMTIGETLTTDIEKTSTKADSTMANTLETVTNIEGETKRTTKEETKVTNDDATESSTENANDMSTKYTNTVNTEIVPTNVLITEQTTERSDTIETKITVTNTEAATSTITADDTTTIIETIVTNTGAVSTTITTDLTTTSTEAVVITTEAAIATTTPDTTLTMTDLTVTSTEAAITSIATDSTPSETDTTDYETVSKITEITTDISPATSDTISSAATSVATHTTPSSIITSNFPTKTTDTVIYTDSTTTVKPAPLPRPPKNFWNSLTISMVTLVAIICLIMLTGVFYCIGFRMGRNQSQVIHH